MLFHIQALLALFCESTQKNQGREGFSCILVARLVITYCITNRESLKMNKQDLYNNLEESIYEVKEELLESVYPEDMLHELVDAEIPVYNHDLLDLVGNCHDFAPGLRHCNDL